MKKTIALFVSIIMLCMLVACGSQDVASPSGTDDMAPLTPQSSATDEQASVAAPSPAKVTITLDYASDELLAKENEYDKYDDTDSKYGVNAAFTTNVALDDFRYVSLAFDASSLAHEGMAFSVQKVLYTSAQLTPEKPLVVTMLLDGAIPSRGIAYTDESGTARYFSISMSGQNDSLLLTEFTPLN